MLMAKASEFIFSQDLAAILETNACLKLMYSKLYSEYLVFRSLKTGTSFLPNASWSHYFQLQITVENSIMLVG